MVYIREVYIYMIKKKNQLALNFVYQQFWHFTSPQKLIIDDTEGHFKTQQILAYLDIHLENIYALHNRKALSLVVNV